MYYINYPDRGEHRHCVSGEAYPHRYTDAYFKRVGISDNFTYIVLSLLYVHNNPKTINDQLFLGVTRTISRNIRKNKRIIASEKQLRVLSNFIWADFKSLKLNYPHHDEMAIVMDKLYNLRKAINHPNDFATPVLSEIFADYLIEDSIQTFDRSKHKSS